MLFKLSRFLIGSDNQRRSGALRWLRCLETGGLQRGNIEDRAQEIGKHVCVYFCTSILKKKKQQTIYLTPGPHRRTFGELRTRQETREMQSGRSSLLLIGYPKNFTFMKWTNSNKYKFSYSFFECAGRFSETVGFSIRRGSTFLLNIERRSKRSLPRILSYYYFSFFMS